MKETKKMGLIPKMAKKIGEKSATSACSWWVCQPKVPSEMKKAK